MSALDALLDRPLWSQRLAKFRLCWPGVLVSFTIALASTFIADNYGGPTMLYALLLGISLHFLSEEGRCQPGVEFAARSVLRLGVCLLGARITADHVVALGIGPVITVIVGVASTLLVGWGLARLLGLGKDLGLLSGGAVAICGASAALAIAAVLPRHEHSERQTILTVVGVTTLSTVAMILYPLLVGLLNLDDAGAGVFLGGTIHDVAQVVGAGYMISEQAGDNATFVKLLRVAMLVPVVLVLSLSFRGSQSGERPPLLPSFLVGFIVLVAINSTGLITEGLGEAITGFSRWCLVTAIAALGIKTSFQKLAVVGWRPVLLLVLETLWLGLLVLAILLSGVLGS